ncbi:triose-phosphate isomerase [Candidatus Woesearchaeota archaeon]|nr:triose-phosphate isomerase [Candidatus Woesearchaeota archaeon]
MLKTPIIMINFKAYEQAIGDKGVQLAQICEMVSVKRNIPIAVAVQTADIYKMSHTVNIPVLAQHVDADEFGSHTGSDIAEDIEQNGAVGTLLNHSEHRMRIDVLEQSIDRAKKAGLATIVCANTPEIAEAVAVFSPDFIAVEPPELIGGTISVSSAKPEVITETVKLVRKVDKRIKILCGAGVHTAEDVRIALKLGTDGVLLASGITKASDPASVLNELCDGIRKPLLKQV